jgi:hypothetical protein
VQRHSPTEDPEGEHPGPAAVTRVCRYEYDFDDGWEHGVRIGQRLASVGSGTPRCLDGARLLAGGLGSPHGYERLLAVLADPSGLERPELLEWLGGEFDPDTFDAAAADELLELYDRHTGSGPGADPRSR